MSLGQGGPLGPEGRFLGWKRCLQWLKPNVFVSAMYGLKPVPFIIEFFLSLFNPYVNVCK
jgi:hypothetical protein